MQSFRVKFGTQFEHQERLRMKPNRQIRCHKFGSKRETFLAATLRSTCRLVISSEWLATKLWRSGCNARVVNLARRFTHTGNAILPDPSAVYDRESAP